MIRTVRLSNFVFSAIFGLLLLVSCSSNEAPKNTQAFALTANGVHDLLKVSLSKIDQLIAALKAISPTDPDAGAQIAELMDGYTIGDLQVALDILLADPNLDAELKKKIQASYDAIFGAPSSSGIRARGLLTSSTILADRLENFLRHMEFNNLPAFLIGMNELRGHLGNLVGIIIDIIRVFPPVMPPPVTPPACEIPLLTNPAPECVDWANYAQCLGQQNLQACQAACTIPGRTCRPVDDTPILAPSCPAPERYVPVDGYVCVSSYRHGYFGNGQCPPPDDRNPRESCQAWDDLGTCLLPICGQGETLVKRCTTAFVRCRTGLVNDFRPVCRWSCERNPRNIRPPFTPGVTGDIF